jgi:hypothetical protein
MSLVGTRLRVNSVERRDLYVGDLSIGDSHLYEVWSISEPRGDKAVSAFENATAARRSFASD